MLHVIFINIIIILVDQNLQKGRRALINSFGGVRYKLKTIDGNFVDSMFINKRLIINIIVIIMNQIKMSL